MDKTAPGKPDETSPKDKTTPSEPAEPSALKETASSKLDQPRPEEREKVSDSDDDSDDNQPLAIASRKRRKLSSSDERGAVSAAAPFVLSLGHERKSVLLMVFQNDISTSKLLTMAEVRTKMHDHMFLRKLAVHEELVKKVADFVHYKTNHTRQMQLSLLGDLNDEDWVALLSMESGLREVWSEHANTVIEAKFASKTKAGKKEILEIFAKDDVLSHILAREGSVRCYEKVKTIMKCGSN